MNEPKLKWWSGWIHDPEVSRFAMGEKAYNKFSIRREAIKIMAKREILILLIFTMPALISTYLIEHGILPAEIIRITILPVIIPVFRMFSGILLGNNDKKIDRIYEKLLKEERIK